MSQSLLYLLTALIAVACANNDVHIHNELSESFVYKIGSRRKLNQFINARNGKRITSKVMTINEFNFQLHFYPNGRFEKQKNDFVVYLCVNNLGETTQVSSMFVDWNLIIHEINFSWISKDRHHSDTSKCRGFTIKNSAQILDPLRVLSQKEDKNALKSLTFGVSINIKRIFSGKAIMNKEIPFKVNRNNKHEWIINDRHILEEMLLSQHQQTFVSDIFDNIWYLSVTPNGYHEDHISSFDMFLHIVQLPKEISKLRMKCMFTIPELNVNHQFNAEWTNSDKGWGWHAMKYKIDLLNEHYSNIKQLSVKSECETLTIFDEEGKEMQFKKNWKYFKITEKRRKTKIELPERNMRYNPQMYDARNTINENDQCSESNFSNLAISNTLDFKNLHKIIFEISQDVSIVQQQLFVTLGIFITNLGATILLFSILISFVCCGCL